MTTITDCSDNVLISVLIPIRSLKQTGKHQTLSHYRNHPNNQCVWIDRLVAHIDITKWPGADLLRHLSNPRRSEWGFSRKGWQKHWRLQMLALSKYWSAKTLIALRIIEAYQRTFYWKLRREVASINGFLSQQRGPTKSMYMVTFRPTHLWDDWINTWVSVYIYMCGASISTVYRRVPCLPHAVGIPDSQFYWEITEPWPLSHHWGDIPSPKA